MRGESNFNCHFCITPCPVMCASSTHMRVSPPSYSSLEDGAKDAADAAHDTLDSPNVVLSTAREPSLHHEPHVLRLRQGYGLWREQQVRRIASIHRRTASIHEFRAITRSPSRMYAPHLLAARCVRQCVDGHAIALPDARRPDFACHPPRRVRSGFTVSCYPPEVGRVQTLCRHPCAGM